MKKDNIRNFCIVAHIDHGKSTLADRLIEKTGSMAVRDMQEQVLDDMDIERERGITIKSHAIRMIYKAQSGKEYIFNLIDTPGHVDFSYEVSRSLAACDGAILVVDAVQGIEAQTLANVYMALDNGLEVLPVINKIDLPAARPQQIKDDIENIIGIEAQHSPCISAKNGVNIDEVLEKIVECLPAPENNDDQPFRALIFDSKFDAYKGVIIYFRVMDGILRLGDTIHMMNTGKEYEVIELGYMKPDGFTQANELRSGEVGYIAASIKNVEDTRVGDTITTLENMALTALPGYKEAVSMVYCGIYPADGSKYNFLKDVLMKLKLNDAALKFEPETSAALGFGFRCAFLGLLHMEIIQERIEREFDLEIITTAPSVIYKIVKLNGNVITVDNPTNMPPIGEIDYMEEPIASAEIIVPTEYVGNIMELCQDRRGTYKHIHYIDKTRTKLEYDIPLNEIIYDFFDALKSRSKGYASLDYEVNKYERSKLVKLDILLNLEVVDALSFIVHESKAYARGRRLAEKLKDQIPRQMFEVPIQAAIGGKIIARETVKAYRKDVIAKCYGGDISRKKKLLEKQKEGKKKMRKLGTVEVPQEAFMNVLKLDT
ncbi:MAG: translation elongation factor 4 [Clostridia bacterium]